MNIQNILFNVYTKEYVKKAKFKYRLYQINYEKEVKLKGPGCHLPPLFLAVYSKIIIFKY